MNTCFNIEVLLNAYEYLFNIEVLLNTYEYLFNIEVLLNTYEYLFNIEVLLNTYEYFFNIVVLLNTCEYFLFLAGLHLGEGSNLLHMRRSPLGQGQSTSSLIGISSKNSISGVNRFNCIYLVILHLFSIPFISAATSCEESNLVRMRSTTLGQSAPSLSGSVVSSWREYIT